MDIPLCVGAHRPGRQGVTPGVNAFIGRQLPWFHSHDCSHLTNGTMFRIIRNVDPFYTWDVELTTVRDATKEGYHMDVQGKVVIITGASMGIGAATARAFADAGAHVVLAARSADKLAAVARSLPPQAEPLIVPTDMTDRAQVHALIERAFAHFGRIDILINNAGQAAAGPVATINPEHYRQIIELNLFGPLHAM